MVELTKTFSDEQYSRALDSWAWLDIEGKAPLYASLFGDVFMKSDEGVWFLDSIQGRLTRVWADVAELHTNLSTEMGQGRYLLAGLALAAERVGKILGPNQVYDLMPPPILGGNFDVEHVTVADFVVTLNIGGQLHEQIRQLPPGTPITGFNVSQP
jgi:hypothetical protein